MFPVSSQRVTNALMVAVAGASGVSPADPATRGLSSLSRRRAVDSRRGDGVRARRRHLDLCLEQIRGLEMQKERRREHHETRLPLRRRVYFQSCPRSHQRSSPPSSSLAQYVKRTGQPGGMQCCSHGCARRATSAAQDAQGSE